MSFVFAVGGAIVGGAVVFFVLGAVLVRTMPSGFR